MNYYDYGNETLFFISDIASEKVPSEVAEFSHDNLKHVETKVTNVLPSSSGV